jgi:RNA polymerase sigma factor (sigma-70 family)
MKSERDPTPEEFDKLLAWLAADRDEAGRKYETIRNRLIRILVTRGCFDAERLTDEVMNRVAVRVDKVVTSYQGDPIRCFHGFAEKVYLEYVRDQREQPLSEPSSQAAPPDTQREREELEQEDACLTQCIGELTVPNGELFRRYFQYEKRAKINARKSLAAELRLTDNALRIKAHRIRGRLRQCMSMCLERLPINETI